MSFDDDLVIACSVGLRLPDYQTAVFFRKLWKKVKQNELFSLTGGNRFANEKPLPIQYEIHQLQAVQPVSPLEGFVSELRSWRPGN